MKIAHIAPESIKFPLKTHSGRYDWLVNLARLQSKHGLDVTVYCNSQSTLDQIEIKGIKTKTFDKYTNNVATFALAIKDNHDIYHSHFDSLHYKMAKSTNKPIVFTQHWWPTEETIKLANHYHPDNVWAVPPTKYMYDFDLSNNIKTNGHIYHGVDLNVYNIKNSDEPTSSKRLLYIGRISPEKNIELAIKASLASKVGLDIIGKITEKNKEYWKNLESRVDGTFIKYHGPQPVDVVVNYYNRALAVIAPFDATEAFGLVAIEAQACGAPIIMKKGGSRSELVKEGVTGFLCDDVAEFIEAINKVSSIDYLKCRNFAKLFDLNVMYLNYMKLYETISKIS